MKRKLTITTVLVAMLLSGCATAPNGNVGISSQGKQALGAVVGAGLGGYLGSKVGGGGKNTAGTVTGTILGGAIGGVLASPSVSNSYYSTAPGTYQNQQGMAYSNQ